MGGPEQLGKICKRGNKQKRRDKIEGRRCQMIQGTSCARDRLILQKQQIIEVCVFINNISCHTVTL